MRRTMALAELVLLGPALLFMTSLFARNLQPPGREPSDTARQIVLWYAGRTHVGLWLFLGTCPLVVLVLGSLALLRAWRTDAELRAAAHETVALVRVQWAALLIAATTVAAG